MVAGNGAETSDRGVRSHPLPLDELVLVLLIDDMEEEESHPNEEEEAEDAGIEEFSKS
jgi:hypothetical protein